ncbi:tetratricopeptide repeat protein [Exilibacterium tricleocarpae]|uniref:Tetratricopeptide repeat protein n=1 Tax=Exilibacterium tricleocarpae TaxID=2591008 RepID=A0A545TAP1_9GAMM|nr:tetratricopeptide repeat protein [Exilibacterium tricleocarpae]
MDTTGYIPQRSTDEETGQLLPYQPAPNPYTALKGRISTKHVQQFVQARQALQVGDLARSKQLLEALTKADTDLSGPWVMLGDIAVQQQQLDEAIGHYAKAIEVNEVNVNAYLKLAKTQRLRGNFVPAQNTYAKALSVWPDFPEAHLNLAVLYDIYLNKPLPAQRHMESYQFLTGGRDKARAQWLAELQQRTGQAIELEAGVTQAVSTTSSRI